MKYDLGYNFIRITFTESELSGSSLTVPEDPAFEKFPVIAYCEDTGALYTGAYDDGEVTLSEYGSGSGGGGGGDSDIVYVPATFDYETGSQVLVCDVTYDTIKGYIESGKDVYIAITDEGETLISSLCYYSFSNHRIMWSIVTGNTDAITYGSVKLEGAVWSYSSILLMTDQ